MSNKNIKIDEIKNEISYYVEITGTEWENLIKKEKEEQIKNLKIDGFRKGKVPANLVNKYIKDEQILHRAYVKYYENNVEKIFLELRKENDRTIALDPSIKMEAISNSELKFTIIFPLDVNEQNIKLDKSKAKLKLEKVSDKEVEQSLIDQLEKVALLMPLSKKDKTQIGDTITLNYKGFVKNEAFEGGEAENYELKLGSKTFIEGFEEQLLDKQIGYKGEIKVTFPKKYPVKNLAGNEAEFKVEILDAKRPENTKLSEDSIKSIKTYGNASTLAEAKTNQKIFLELSKLNLSLSKFISELIQDIKTNSKLIISEKIVNFYASKKKEELEKQLKTQKIHLDEYIKILGRSAEEFNQMIKDEEKENLLSSYIGSALSKSVQADDIKILEEDINNILYLQSFTTGMPIDLIKTFINNDNIKKQIEDQIKANKLDEKILSKYDSKGFEEYKKTFENVLNLIKKIVDDNTKKEEASKEEKKTSSKKATAKKETK
ncbi:trigger factor [Mycoplasmopsis lipofaciens]|uniref:trigger factor n=1 Tax=Mycoplasmopsis lipofaciens TaxID=114884 RepID=UPI0004850F1F|nr:trigger factor [Mycoplasmopsis lipofaciens]